MKSKKKKPAELAKVPKSERIAIIASQIKDKSLFPEKIEEAKKILAHARFVK